MRNNRLIRKRGNRTKKEVLDLDITSLLDILVIMLVFLLNSYNSSGIILNVPKGVTLPKSESQSLNTNGVVVQVSPDMIWVDDKEIVDLKKIELASDGMIAPLYDELMAKKKLIKQIEQSAENANKFSGNVNLIVDKTIRYSFIRRLMFTAAEAGYKQYKFVVLGEE